jgi:polyferredoxin
LAAEHESKNWLKILIKFRLWFAFLAAVFFLFIFTVVAFAWGADIIDPLDPFKIYKPVYLTLTGAIFVGILLVSSLFIYRPWCHLFYPFGLVGWLVEKASRIRISVDYETCIACQKCATACP